MEVVSRRPTDPKQWSGAARLIVPLYSGYEDLSLPVALVSGR